MRVLSTCSLACVLAAPALLLAQAAPARAAAPTLAEKAAARTITPAFIRGHVRFLASDAMEGRAPASAGDVLAQSYIAAQMEALGLEPGAPGGKWLQPFDVVSVNSHAPETTTFSRGAEKLSLKLVDEYIAVSGNQAPQVKVDGAEVVFVGYGITAPEFGWDDFKGMDLTGKVLLMMNNDPEDDPQLFAGKKRLYYGRWDYKFESAARVGALAAIIIHTAPSAGYGWNVIQSSWTGEQFALPEEGNGPRLQVRGWTTDDAAKRLAKLGGHDLDTLRAAAQKKDFKPVPLGVSWSIAVKNDIKKAQTANVIGRLPGRDAGLSQQAVLYTAHFDHLGKKADARPGEDAIYNGARDNASGVAAMLAVAHAMGALSTPPRRSVYFAAVAAEEQGLLGSRYLAAHPPIPAGRLAADINVDEMNTWGRTRDLVIVGLGKSTLDDVANGLAAGLGREIKGEPYPEKGYFYRSDQFSFAKIGVPAVFFNAGTDVVGKAPGWGREQLKEYEEKRYHQPADELRPEWDLTGAAEDAQFFFYMGLSVANAAAMPAWRPGDEFEAARKQALAQPD